MGVIEKTRLHSASVVFDEDGAVLAAFVQHETAIYREDGTQHEDYSPVLGPRVRVIIPEILSLLTDSSMHAEATELPEKPE